MGAKITTTSISGYNSSPPSDDGAQTASNLITWAKSKEKLGDPIKTALESINTKLVAYADFAVRRITSSDSLVAGDHMRTVEIGPSVSTVVTVTLADAATMTNVYRVYIKNSGSKAATIARDTSGDTIDGVAGDITLPVGSSVLVTTNNAADGYLLTGLKLGGRSLSGLPAGVGPLPYAGATVPSGWLECDGSAVSRTTYADLFAAISTTWGVGDGSTTFNVPDMRGKVPVGSGTGTVTASGTDSDVDTTADTLTVASNNTKWVTGMAVVFNLTSGTITGLTDNNTYYVVRASSTTIKLASTLALAQAGTGIDLTAKSSPVWDITHTFTARTVGEYGGEQSHAMSSTELLAHTHSGSTVAAGATISGGGDTSTGTIGSTGGNAAMNIMQPFAVTKYIISY